MCLRKFELPTSDSSNYTPKHPERVVNQHASRISQCIHQYTDIRQSERTCELPTMLPNDNAGELHYSTTRYIPNSYSTTQCTHIYTSTPKLADMKHVRGKPTERERTHERTIDVCCSRRLGGVLVSTCAHPKLSPERSEYDKFG